MIVSFATKCILQHDLRLILFPSLPKPLESGDATDRMRIRRTTGSASLILHRNPDSPVVQEEAATWMRGRVEAP